MKYIYLLSFCLNLDPTRDKFDFDFIIESVFGLEVWTSRLNTNEFKLQT